MPSCLRIGFVLAVVGVCSTACVAPMKRTAFTTPDSPNLAPDRVWPASADFDLLGLTSGTACADVRDLEKATGTAGDGLTGHPVLYQQAKYDALDKAKDADNLTAIRVKVEISNHVQCVTVTGRAYRLKSLKLEPSAGSSDSGVSPAPVASWRSPNSGRSISGMNSEGRSGTSHPQGFGWSLLASIPYSGNFSLDSHFSFPVGGAIALGPVVQSFAIDAGVGLVSKNYSGSCSNYSSSSDSYVYSSCDEKGIGVVGRLGVDWNLQVRPSVTPYLRPHLDYGLNIDGHPFDGIGFGVDAGIRFKLGSLVLLAELGTDHLGAGFGFGY